MNYYSNILKWSDHEVLTALKLYPSIDPPVTEHPGQLKLFNESQADTNLAKTVDLERKTDVIYVVTLPHHGYAELDHRLKKLEAYHHLDATLDRTPQASECHHIVNRQPSLTKPDPCKIDAREHSSFKMTQSITKREIDAQRRRDVVREVMAEEFEADRIHPVLNRELLGRILLRVREDTNLPLSEGHLRKIMKEVNPRLYASKFKDQGRGRRTRQKNR